MGKTEHTLNKQKTRHHDITTFAKLFEGRDEGCDFQKELNAPCGAERKSSLLFLRGLENVLQSRRDKAVMNP